MMQIGKRATGFKAYHKVMQVLSSKSLSLCFNSVEKMCKRRGRLRLEDT